MKPQPDNADTLRCLARMAATRAVRLTEAALAALDAGDEANCDRFTPAAAAEWERWTQLSTRAAALEWRERALLRRAA